MDDVLRSVIEIARRHLPPTSAAALGQDPDADLSALGLTSLRTVDFLVEVEERLGVALPEEAIRAETFRTPRTVADTLRELPGESAR
ncbi:phosphopantetheine-binding protein [Micromonospora sp. DT233]|uniref:phosphopantetheine-binding protein n=1 Tax=Micromonospora sp. DT233 TaxID=3393432 RepID=UPI003CEE9C70